MNKIVCSKVQFQAKFNAYEHYCENVYLVKLACDYIS